MNYCYWNQAALALAERQTKDMSEELAGRLLTQAGDYINPASGSLFPFPSPEPSPELLEKYPGLTNLPRNANAKLKLLHHREMTFQRIIDALKKDEKITFYSPATHLKINAFNEGCNPVVDIDELARMIMKRGEVNTEQPAPTLTDTPPAPAAQIKAWHTEARKIGEIIYKKKPARNIDQIADEVYKEMMARNAKKELNMTGRGGKVPSAASIKRHALTGLKS